MDTTQKTLTKRWLLDEAIKEYPEDQKSLENRMNGGARATTNIILPVQSFEFNGDSYQEDEASAGKMTPIKMVVINGNNEPIDVVGVFCHSAKTCDISAPQVSEIREFASSFAEFFINKFLLKHHINLEHRSLWNNIPEN